MGTILVVDDYEIHRYRYRALVQNMGHRCLEASDGSEAFSLFKRHRPDGVLLDVSLGAGEDGFGVLAKIKAEFPRAKVIMLTASGLRGDVQDAIEAAADGYILKTAGNDRIEQAIRALTHRPSEEGHEGLSE